MKSFWTISFATVVLLQVISCSQEKPTSEKLQGLHKYYFPDGKIYLEINYKDSLPHGLAKRYYKSGRLLEESIYRDGVLHGITKMYHENGNLSSLIPYDSGRVHGLKKKYRKDGSPASEAPYYKGQPCVGLQELFLSGRPVDNHPTIVITRKKDQVKPNVYTFELTISNGARRVQFYEGALTDGKYIGSTTTAIKTSGGVGTIVYVSAPTKLESEFQSKKLNVIAKVRTELGNEYITQATLDLAKMK
jgi:hypothetical protein